MCLGPDRLGGETNEVAGLTPIISGNHDHHSSHSGTNISINVRTNSSRKRCFQDAAGGEERHRHRRMMRARNMTDGIDHCGYD